MQTGLVGNRYPYVTNNVADKKNVWRTRTEGEKNVKTRWAGLSRSLLHTPSHSLLADFFPKGKVSCLGLALAGSSRSPRRTLTRGRGTPLASQRKKKPRGHHRNSSPRESAQSPRATPAGARPRFRFTSGHCSTAAPARPTAYGAARLAFALSVSSSGTTTVRGRADSRGRRDAPD